MSAPEILRVEVNWYDDASNWPSLTVLLDRKPEFGVYEKRPLDDERRGHVYLSSDGPFAWFFVWNGKPDQGFGGWRRTITLSDGTEEEIVGGWHTGPRDTRETGFGDYAQVAYRTDLWRDRDGAERLVGGTVVFVTEEYLTEALERLLPDVEPDRNQFGSLTVKWRGQISKTEHIKDRSACPYSKLGPAQVVAINQPQRGGA